MIKFSSSFQTANKITATETVGSKEILLAEDSTTTGNILGVTKQKLNHIAKIVKYVEKRLELNRKKIDTDSKSIEENCNFF